MLRRHAWRQGEKLASRLGLALLICGMALLSAGGYGSPHPAAAFDTWRHADATRLAMNANGFSADARLLVQVEDYLTDALANADLQHIYKRIPGYKGGNPIGIHGIDLNDFERVHFDDLFSTSDVEMQWTNVLANTKAALDKYTTSPSVKSGFRKVVLFTIIGMSLHMIQDFYSHSNWVPVWVAKQPGKPVPIWYDVPKSQRDALKLFSGAYPDGCCKGHMDHGKLNMDNSSRPYSLQADDVANRASVQWLHMIMEDTNVPWAALQSYKVDPQIGKHFLYDLDATFVTSSSIVAGHWDGPHPAKYVFSSDPDKESRMALQALAQVLIGYMGNIALKGNVYQLPSPNWAGIYVYHVERDMTKNLLPVRPWGGSSE
jgi:hypothetical protein